MTHKSTSPRQLMRRARIEAGKCSECGKPRGKDGTSTKCRYCADLQRVRSDRKKLHYVANGRCVCGSEKSFFEYRCDKCQEKHKKESKQLRDKRKDNGVCTRCGRRLTEGEGKTTCINCRDRNEWLMTWN